MGGTNNTNFTPREDLENINSYSVTNAGWYTLEHVFYDAGGILAVDLNLVNDIGTVLFTETRSDAADAIPAEVGGNRYSWFTALNIPGGIIVDNHRLEIQEALSTTESTLVVVYDPEGGFVTGGGWIDSPEGAMVVEENQTFWNQTFDANLDGWFDSTNGWYGLMTLQGDGSALFEGDGVSAPFSRFDGYRDTWTGPWTASIDVYLDPAWPSGQGFDYSVASSRSDGTHLRDFIFHLGVVGGSGLLVNGSNNADFTTNSYKLLNENGGNYHTITTAGWYTLQHVFYDAGGFLAVDLNLLDVYGNLLWTVTRSNVSDTIPDVVGGNRYSWFTHIDVVGGILVDNHTLSGSSAAYPTGKANFGFVSKYKKGANVPTGNTEFVFKAGGLNFHSSTYDWLVVTGSDYAKFKGEGTVNNMLSPAGTPYKFMIWAGDRTGSDGSDTFRIKIWYEDSGMEYMLYDNGMDQAISGGNIVVHNKK